MIGIGMGRCRGMNFPGEIVYEIFIRMPTKPLLRLRCLSKHWNLLISDYFMKSRSRRMILLPHHPFQAIDISTSPREGTTHSVVKLCSSFEDSIRAYSVPIIGTFNGIVVLLLRTQMILYNPFTGVSKILPDPPFRSNTYPFGGYGLYGTTLDDLKIVRVTIQGKFFDALRLCDVFSFKNGTWSITSSESVPLSTITQYVGTFVNGYMYWTACKDLLTQVILALDVKDMVFSEIQLPLPLSTLTTSGHDRLGTLNGHLCFYHVDNGSIPCRFELWVMKENDIGKSWSRLIIATSDWRSICILDDGRNVMINEGHLIIYDMLKDSYKDVQEINGSCGYRHAGQAMEYVETLISPSDLCSSLI